MHRNGGSAFKPGLKNCAVLLAIQMANSVTVDYARDSVDSTLLYDWYSST